MSNGYTGEIAGCMHRYKTTPVAVSTTLSSFPRIALSVTRFLTDQQVEQLPKEVTDRTRTSFTSAKSGAFSPFFTASTDNEQRELFERGTLACPNAKRDLERVAEKEDIVLRMWKGWMGLCVSTSAFDK